MNSVNEPRPRPSVPVGAMLVVIGIIRAVVSSIGLLVGLKALSDINDLIDFGRLLGQDIGTGPGLYVAVAGGMLGSIGSIITIAKQPA